MKRPLLFGLAVLTVAASALAIQANQKLVINGKSVEGKTIVSNGQTYVPVSALKAGGAVVTSKEGTLTITIAAPGGANQLGALEGGLNEWLFNGIWRFRVLAVNPLEGDRPGWKVDVELRNGTTADNMALDGTGFQSVQLVMEDQNIIPAPYNITEFNRPVGQGSTIKESLIYFDDEGNGRKPIKMIVRITPDDPTKAFLKRMGAVYSVPDPSFRINLVPKDGGN